MEREKELNILYQKTRSDNPFSSKATSDRRLQKENDDLQRLFSSNLAQARVQISLLWYFNINADVCWCCQNLSVVDVMKQIWREICYCENEGMNMYLSPCYMCLFFCRNEEVEIKTGYYVTWCLLHNKKREICYSYFFFFFSLKTNPSLYLITLTIHLMFIVITMRSDCSDL